MHIYMKLSIELTSTTVEIFERKRADLKGHQKQIFQLFHINTVALRLLIK
jgi:hypothetical protein